MSDQIHLGLVVLACVSFAALGLWDILIAGKPATGVAALLIACANGILLR